MVSQPQNQIEGSVTGTGKGAGARRVRETAVKVYRQVGERVV